MEMWGKVLHSICNIGTRGLPDMYTLGPAALGPQGVHIRQTTRAHVINTKYSWLIKFLVMARKPYLM